MEDLRGSLPSDDINLDEAIPNVIDTELLRERTGGDEAFVEELQESLRPLCVLLCVNAALLTTYLVLGSGVTSGPGSTASLTSIGTGSPSSMGWWTLTSVGNTLMILVQATLIPMSFRLVWTKHEIHPYPHDPRSRQATPQLLSPGMIPLHLKFRIPFTMA